MTEGFEVSALLALALALEEEQVQVQVQVQEEALATGQIRQDLSM